MMTPAVVSRHNAMRSLRARATMVVLRIRPPRRRTRSWNHRLSAEVGWFCSHSQASSTIVVLNLAYHGARAQDSSFNITLERDYAPALAEIELAPQEMTRYS